jgi:hypothetical protein
LAKKQDHSAGAQYEKFVATARELGCDEDKERFERKLGQLATAAPRPPKAVPAKLKAKARKTQ